MQVYCKPFHYIRAFKEDHKKMENFNPAITKIPAAKGIASWLRVIMIGISIGKLGS